MAMTIPDEVERAAREPTDAELAESLRKFMTDLDVPVRLSPFLLFAAQRLAARGEISEAMVERMAKTLHAQHRAIYDITLPKWDKLTDFQRYALTQRARAALEAALSAHETKEG